jgi:hypothetical protein
MAEWFRARYWRSNLVAAALGGTSLPHWLVDRVERTLRILVDRSHLICREAHRVAEVRSSHRFRSAVHQLTIDLAWSIATFHEVLIDRRIRSCRTCRTCCSCRSCRGCRRSIDGNRIARSTPNDDTGKGDECKDSHAWPISYISLTVAAAVKRQIWHHSTDMSVPKSRNRENGRRH